MKGEIIKIRNNSVIKIPTDILDRYGFANEVEINFIKNCIIIKPVNKHPRKNWSKKMMEMHTEKDDTLLLSDTFDNVFDNDTQW